jgi:hypothetical protein
MNTNKKLRKLRSLIHSYDMCFGNYLNFDLIEHLDSRIKSVEGYNSQHAVEHFNAYTQIKELVLELGIDKFQYFKISKEESQKIHLSHQDLRLNTLKETRDNKGVYVGNGGSNGNKIRYPKKNKSAKTWKIFYKMFPSRAIIDEYDGKTSKRMK